MLSKEAFIKRWRTHLAGLALYGRINDTKPALAKAETALEIPAQVEAVLSAMYEGLQLPPAAPATLVNEPAKPVVRPEVKK
jgi:hypothetical protein